MHSKTTPLSAYFDVLENGGTYAEAIQALFDAMKESEE